MDKLTNRGQFSNKNTDGFSLIELLVSISILSIFAGVTYSTFQMATRTYNNSELRISLMQKCRASLNQVTTDLVNLQAVEGDTNLLLVSQDTESDDSGVMQQDIISFVTLVKTTPDPIVQQLNRISGTETGSETEELSNSTTTDVQRIIYMIGPEPEPLESMWNPSSLSGQLQANRLEEETTEVSLLRIATTELDPEVIVTPLLETGELPDTDEEGNPIEAVVTAIATQVSSFDLKYFDGEEWYESWEDPELIPLAVQVLVSVSEDATYNQEQTNSDSSALSDNAVSSSSGTVTQSTLVYLVMSANFSRETGG